MKGHQSKDCPKKFQQQGQNQGNNTSTAQNTETPKAKEAQPPPTSKSDAPPVYNEDHIAGLIHAMTMEQQEILLGKVVSNGKGKSKGVVDDREPSFDSDNKDF